VKPAEVPAAVKEFLDLVAKCEREHGIPGAIVTSIAFLVVAVAYMHGLPKPAATEVGGIGDAGAAALRESIDCLWKDCAALPREQLALAADCCLAHLKSRGVHVDLGILGPAPKV